MSKNQTRRIVLILVVLAGAFFAQKTGLIDLNRFTGGTRESGNLNATGESTTGENTNGDSKPTRTRTRQGKTQVRQLASKWKLPEDRTEICASDLTTSGPQDRALYEFAKTLGLSYPETFVRVSNHINQTGRLPDCYMSKGEARNLGWSGGPLWEYARGRAIGGDRFGNREGRLPQQYTSYIEADLDYDGRRRGADRLVFVKGSKGQWLQWVTVNHYDSFQQVPQGR